MRYTRTNFCKWLEKMPPDSRPFGKRSGFAGEVPLFNDTLCPLAEYLGLGWSFLAVKVDWELTEAIDAACDERYSKLTPRKILSIIRKLEKG